MEPIVTGFLVRAQLSGETGWQLVACNDTLGAFEGILRIGEETLAGESKWGKELRVSVPANSSIVLAEVDAPEFSGATDSFLHAELVCGDEKRTDVFFPNFWKDAPWPEPNLEIVTSKSTAVGLDVTIRTE